MRQSGFRPIVGLIALSVVVEAVIERRAFDVFDFVDPLIGTINGGKVQNDQSEWSFQLTMTGHVFPGATLPFGKSRRCTT